MKEKIKPFYPPQEETIITGEDIEKIRRWRKERKRRQVPFWGIK